MSEQYVVELSGLPYFRGNFVQSCSFPIFNFSENRVEFFLCERSNRLRWLLFCIAMLQTNYKMLTHTQAKTHTHTYRQTDTHTHTHTHTHTYTQTHIYIYIYICVCVCCKLLLATVVENDTKAPFSIATRPRCRGGRYIHIYIYIYIYIACLKVNNLTIKFVKLWVMSCFMNLKIFCYCKIWYLFCWWWCNVKPRRIGYVWTKLISWFFHIYIYIYIDGCCRSKERIRIYL